MNNTKTLVYFLCFNLLLWSLVPCLRGSLPMDTQEAIVWGKFCSWITTKHPPFSAWIAYYFYVVFGSFDKVMYLLSQIMVISGIYYIYKLAKLFVDKDKALLAALLQFGIIYYHFSAVEYNVNVVSIALWPMCAYYFWLAYTQNKWKDWLLFGLLVGLNLLNKYVSVALLFGFGVFVIIDNGWRKIFFNIKAYLAGIIALMLVFPHIYALYQTDFAAIDYIAERNHTGKITSAWRYLFYPLKFLVAQVLFSAAAWVTYMVFYSKNMPEKIRANQQKTKFLLSVGILPLLLFAAIGLISGNALKSMWGFPCLFAVGIMLFYFYPFTLNENNKRNFVKVMTAWSCLFAIAYAVQCVVTTSERFTLNNKDFVRQIEQKWQEYTGNNQPIEYVGADVWYADMFALYGTGNIKPMVWMNPKNNTWFDVKDFEQKGALIVATDLPEYGSYAAMYGDNISAPQKFEFNTKNYFGKNKKREIYYGFYNVKGSR